MNVAGETCSSSHRHKLKDFLNSYETLCDMIIPRSAKSVIHSSIHSSIHHPFVSPSLYPFISIRPSIHSPIHPSILGSIHSSIHLSIYSSIHPSTHSFIHTFIHPSREVSSDAEFTLYGVTLFRKVLEEFKRNAREKKWVHACMNKCMN